MRRLLVIAVGWTFLIAACGNGDSRSTAAGSTTSDPVSSVSPTSTTTTPPDTSTDAPSTPATTSPAVGPDYIVSSPAGVFRVVDGVAVLVVGRPDVSWTADDGLGGVVYYSEAGVVEHLPAGATDPVQVAGVATPDFVTLVDGRPSLVISQIQPGDCDDTDSQHATVIDLATGEQRRYVPCVPLESSGIHPQSMGGTFALSIDGGGWPGEEPVSARLVFRSVELPESITALTGWDEEASARFAETELDLPGNPWPDPCHWCTLDARLSRDGTTLALAEFVPDPTQLGATDWDEYNSLDLDEQWQRWEDLRRAADLRLRLVDLGTGDALYSEQWPGPGRLLDFDGRYLVYQFGGMGHHSQFPFNTHLIDTITGEEVTINWGVGDPEPEGHISLALAG